MLNELCLLHVESTLRVNSGISGYQTCQVSRIMRETPAYEALAHPPKSLFLTLRSQPIPTYIILSGVSAQRPTVPSLKSHALQVFDLGIC